jgi:hypothetical protein
MSIRKLKLFNDEALEYPNYLIVLNQHKLKRIIGALVYKLKKNLLIQNDIYVILDNYQHRNNSRLLFYNNEKKYKTVYKKFSLNEKALYIPIEEYSKYYLKLKTKICTSILESLGVKSIEFKHNEFTHNILNIDAHTSISSIKLSSKINNEEKDTYKNNDIKIYNKGHCKYLFKEPNEFEEHMKEINGYIMDVTDFENDLELRNLIRSRLVGNLIEYDLKYEIDYMSSVEVDLSANFTNSDNAGLNVKKYANKKLNVNLHIKFYKYSELINNDNIELKEKCLQLLVNYDNNGEDGTLQSLLQSQSQSQIQSQIQSQSLGESQSPVQSQPIQILSAEDKDDIRQNNKKHNLLNSFIDKFMKEKAKDKLEEYKMIKIADPKYISNMINNIKTMEDLNPNGVFLNGFTSLVYATLLPFNDDGLIKIQKIYTWLKRHNYSVEYYKKEMDNDPNICYNIRCMEYNCNNPIKSIRVVFCYIIRVYNDENQANILTYGLETDKELTNVLRYIAINLKHFTNYEIFSEFTTKHINLYRIENEPGFKEMCSVDLFGNIIEIKKSKKFKLFNYINSLFYSS